MYKAFSVNRGSITEKALVLIITVACGKLLKVAVVDGGRSKNN